MPKLFETGKELVDKYGTYTKKIQIPQYEPKQGPVSLDSLLDLDKYSKLIKKINESNVPEDEKRFLRFAATRHIAFHYNCIADYYAQASAEMQDCMEDSALVILDVDDAIAKGYVTLTEDIKKIMFESGRSAGD